MKFAIRNLKFEIHGLKPAFMATLRSFEEIEIWKRARTYAQNIYKQTSQGTFARDFSLKDQINASSGSIMDNIAEGHGRGGNKEFINFLSYARGSADESRSQLYRALDRNHLTEQTFLELRAEAMEISKMLSGFMTYLQGSNIKGSKFTEPSVMYNFNHEE